jgi:hypothetical protein
MGHITHRAVLVFTWTKDANEAVEQFRANLPSRYQGLLVGPVEGVVNSHSQWAFLSSGSKDGWPDHDKVDRLQDEFVKLFEQFRYDDDGSSTSFKVITVQVGEGEQEPLLYDSPKTYLEDGGCPYVPRYSTTEE